MASGVRGVETFHGEPLKLDTDRMVTKDELVDIVAEAAGKELRNEHNPANP